MQLDIVRQPLPLTLLLLVLLLFLFWSGGKSGEAGGGERTATTTKTTLQTSSGTVTVAQNADIEVPTMPLDRLLSPSERGFLYRFGTAALFFLGALLVTRIVTRNMVLVVRTYLPALFFVIVALGFYLPENGPGSAATTLLLIIGSDRLIAGFRRKASFDPLFRGAFLLGTMPLIYAPSVLFFLMIPVAVILFRRDGRETTVALFGYVLPFLICSYVYWGMGYPFGHIGQMLVEALSAPAGEPLFTIQAGLWRMVLAAILLLLTILSLISFAGHAAQTRTRARRIFLYFIYMLLPAAGLFLLPSRSTEIFALAAVPLAIILPNYFVRHTGNLPALLYLLMLCCAIAIRFIPSPF